MRWRQTFIHFHAGGYGVGRRIASRGDPGAGAAGYHSPMQSKLTNLNLRCGGGWLRRTSGDEEGARAWLWEPGLVSNLEARPVCAVAAVGGFLRQEAAVRSVNNLATANRRRGCSVGFAGDRR